MTAQITKDTEEALERWKLRHFEAPPRHLQPTSLPTAERVERVYQQATEQGYQAGYTEGFAKAREAGERVAQLVTKLEREVGSLDQTIAENLLHLALTVARQVLTTALDVKPELIVPLAREAVQGLAHSGAPATLTLHPDDAALVREAIGEHLEHSAVRILEDKALTRGGCVLHSAGSTIDASVETRWKRVIESIGADPGWVK